MQKVIINMDVKGKKVLVVATCGPETPDRCAAPFFFAKQAADLGAEANICFILHSALLLKPGVAETVCAKEGGRPVRSFLEAAIKSGVTLNVCDAALKMNDMTPDDLIDEVDNLVGPSFLITQGLASDLVLNF
jgi:predicted peroxiredoxin